MKGNSLTAYVLVATLLVLVEAKPHGWMTLSLESERGVEDLQDCSESVIA